jgi:hypothetical protein
MIKEPVAYVHANGLDIQMEEWRVAQAGFMQENQTVKLEVGAQVTFHDGIEIDGKFVPSTNSPLSASV